MLYINQVYIHHYIKNVIIEEFMLSFITLLCTFNKFSTINMQILIRLKRLLYVLLDRFFPNTRVNEKVCIFSHTISNALRNFVSHKSMICDKKIQHGSTVRQTLSYRKKTMHTSYIEMINPTIVLEIY